MRSSSETLVTRLTMEVAVALFTAAIGAIAVFGSVGDGIGWDDAGPQSGYFPFYIGLIVIVASLGALVQAVIKHRDRKAVFLTREQGQRVLSFSLPMAAFVLVANFLGLYVGLLLYLFGLSAWWLVVFCGAIVLWGYRNIRRVSPALDKVTAIASTGFVMILVASSGFEAIRFYSLDINLPLAPGGLLGRFVGLGLQQFIGFAGATMLLLLVWAIGISLFTGLSWLDLMEKMLHEDDLRIFPEDLYAQGHVLHSPEAVVYSPKELMEMDWLDECVEGALPHYDELDVKTHVLMAINGLNTLKGFVK